MRIIHIKDHSIWQTYIKPFLEFLKKRDLTPKTISAYEHDLTLFLKWLFNIEAKRLLTSLTEIDIIEYRQFLMDSGLKAATINRRIGSIQRLCDWLVDHKFIKKNIAQSIKQVHVVKKHCPSGLKASEIQLLLQASGQSKHSHSKRNYALLHLMLQTGIRVNEVAQLKFKDIELRQRSGNISVNFGKGRKSRIIPLNSKARRALKLYFNDRDEKNDNAHVFLSERNTPLSVRAIQSIISTLAKRAGIKRIKVSPHTLRHTFAINYLKQHASNIVELANLLGHESLDTTAIYTQPSMEDLANNLESMNSI